MPKIRFFFLLPFFLGFTACNHLYYHPTQNVYATPEMLDLSYEDWEWETPSTSSRPAIQTHTLHAWLIRANHQPALGTVLHFHGNAQNMTSHFLFVAWLAKAGYHVVTFDYSGYGSSEGEPNREQVLIDGITAYRETLKWNQSLGPSATFVVVGQSLGGAVAVTALSELYPELQSQVDALILDSTFSSYRSQARRALAGLWLTWPFQYPLSFLISDESSPVDVAGKIKNPLISFHGTGDRVVSYQEGVALFESMASQPKQLVLIQNAPHTYGFGAPEPTWRIKALNFLCRLRESNQRDLCQTRTDEFEKNWSERFPTSKGEK